MHESWSNSGKNEQENWRQMTDTERLALVERIRILHPRLRPLLEQMDQCAQSAAEVPPDHVDSPLNMAVAGQAGVGKTVLAEIWLTQAVRKIEVRATNTPSPYHYLSLPVVTTQKALIAALIQAAMGSRSLPRYQGTTVWRMEQLLFHLLPASGIHLIILDNCDHFNRHQSRHTTSSFIELLVRMMSQRNLSLILLGETGAMEQIIEACPKLERRVGGLLQLAPFSWDRAHPETVMEWRSLLATLDRALPFDESGLAAEDIAYRLIYATDGLLGWLMRLISVAAKKAICEASTALSLRDLAYSYQLCIANTSMGRGKVNPFSASDCKETEA